MKNILFAISIMLCFMNMQCSDDDTIDIDTENLLIGNWVEPNYNDEEVTYSRAANLPNEAYGISFKENGDFVERSSGWCGTPPLIFSDYEGEWELDDTLIKISQEYYPNNYAWRIVSLTENKLVVKRELTEQELEYQELMKLYNEAYAFIVGVSCTDANDWSYTGYGSKACGGSQGYMAYPTTIDTDVFLAKIKAYSDAEAAYNVKWSIVSTCDLPAQPTSVECQNGYPILKY